MRIANVIRRIAFDEWGGIESAVWNSSKVLRASGSDVEIFATKALCNVGEESVDGIPIHRFDCVYPYLFLSDSARYSLDKKGGNPFSLGLYRALLASRADIVHSHTMGRIAKEARMAARKIGAPFALTFHGGYYDIPQSELDDMAKPTKGKIGFGRVVEKIFALDFDLVESADGIICVGGNELEALRSRFPKKISAQIPNGVDSAKFDGIPKCDFRAKYKIPGSAKLVLCVSRIDPQKNQKALVGLVGNLLSKGVDAHCAIIGFPTSPTYLAEIRADIAAHGLSEKFTIVEGLAPDSDELVAAFCAADVFVLPSVHEPFGIVALEAWSAGVPLAASRVGGLCGLVRDGETGFSFDPNSPDEILAATLAALKHSEVLRTAAKRIAREKYSWEAVGKMLNDFYGRLENGGR